MKHYRRNASLLLLSLSALLPISAAGLQTETTTRTPDPKQQVIDLERQAREATLKRDPEFSERTLSDDYVAITPLGQVINKSDTINARRSGQLRYDSIDVTEMVVRLYGNTAVVTARAEVRGGTLAKNLTAPIATRASG
jgi:hypothetical protein